MKNTYKITKAYTDHLGQHREIYCIVDECYIEQYCENAAIEGYSIVNIEKA